MKVVEDWRALKWSKLALNVVANASCAILNVLPNRFVHFDKIFTLEIRMIREVRAVMQAMKIVPIDLPRYPVRALFNVAALPSPVSRTLLAHSIAGARGTKPPSLLLDLRRARAANRSRRPQRRGRRGRPRTPRSRRPSTPSTRAC